MAKAAGILTQTGGATSHAAVVARAMDKPCVVGATELDIEALEKDSQSGLKLVTIDGATGRVWYGVDVPVIDASADPAVRTVMEWCLYKLGAVEASPVGLGATDHRVFVAHWWGSAEVADAVLADLAKTANPAKASLDIRSPWQLAQHSDLELLDCFGVAPSNDFANTVVKLVGQHPALNGELGLCGADAAKIAVPAEYAAYRVLSH
jgi:PEP-utilising enzyme, mobile domain